jgi:maleate cis-trans isomerase
MNCFDCHELEQELKIARLMADIAYQRVRELHKGDPDNICTQCGYLYPCPTIEAFTEGNLNTNATAVEDSLRGDGEA